ncbi:vesicular glutamate transporter 2.2 [Tribolium castaneum]|uniref:Sialin n=1 Tax=Tribolium castaneum TaxID=7070 RepID=D6WN85_TRICA|nr:PREDICTED: vesicular glutamate transporter 2.2 [Tribolium castaneum]EFA03048.1 Putative inorganic phosphate cotransporter-like Protein [Tribolium castaneum]|eukprot:XP_970624.1 PREDICTED: vesicular glutamate transporter 2.2 [Tribolium castaneum]
MALTNEKVQTYGTETTVNESTETHPGWMFWKKRRYVVATLAFFGFFNVYALRVNLSIAIVAMTENKSITLDNGTIIYGPEFDWDSKIQGYILSSFFYGYITTQLFGGWLSARIGGKRVFGGGIAITAALTLITPWLAKVNVYLLLAVRIIEGIFEGVTYPCIHAVWARWAPPLERTRLATLAFSGSYVGTVVSMPVCAYLAKALGWPSIFYFFGTLGLIWFGIWWVVVAETPAEDSKITKAELKYIKESLGHSDGNRRITHPWKEILLSMPVWAIVVSHFSENWGFYTLLTQLPKFMKEILNFELGKTGFMSALPYLAMSIMIQFSGHLADWLQEKGILNTTQVRKLFNCGAFIAQTVFMLGAAFWLTPAGTISCLTLAVGLGGFAWSGFSVNYLDVAPQHASVLMGLGNTVGTLPGILSPIISGYVVTTPTAQEWQIIFYIASGVYLFGCVFYGVFASGEVQPWAIQKEEGKGTPMKERETKGHDNKSFEPDL